MSLPLHPSDRGRGSEGRRRGRSLAGGVAGAASLLAGALLLGACAGTPEPTGGEPTTLPAQTDPVPEAASDPATDPALQPYYGQAVEWVPCGEVLECAVVTVPVDWAAPEGQTLELAVSRVPAGDGDERLGSLVANPGGPGASGVDYVGADGAVVASEDVRERYDVVGFDPRGVGSSEPVDCLDDAELDEFLAADVDTTTPEGVQEARALAEGFATGCLEDAGELLGNVDTLSVARDLDVLRAVLGDERLTYLGKSYGTLVGAEYAELFPQRVGRLVLDGALDPSSSADEVSVGQAEGLESSLRAFVTACLEGDVEDCPLGTGDGADEAAVDAALGQVADLVEGAGEAPLPTQDPGRPLTRPLASTGVVAPLYDEMQWQRLADGLTQALDGDGTALLTFADAYAGRTPEGTYSSNLLEAFTAVSCLDYPPSPDDEAATAALQERLEEVAPTFSSLLVGEDVGCQAWPVPSVRTPAPVTAAGAAPILVVGTTNDPATPYVWSQALAEQLESGRLLTYEGEGHTAYLRVSDCVDGAVDAYLLEGVLPGEGAGCAA